ncbi:MAG: dual specificity protein phosphatase [Candidatus Gastranaerophilales bacterium]|nr:dual specificity protein phosphatase [Candidatus Gastranaerophilales bacterium]
MKVLGINPLIFKGNSVNRSSNENGFVYGKNQLNRDVFIPSVSKVSFGSLSEKFSEVIGKGLEERLFRSSLPSVQDFAELKQKGITTILDLCGLNHEEARLAKEHGMEYLHFERFNQDNQEHLKQAVNFVEEQLKAGKKVLVHCEEGKNRTGSVIKAYLEKCKEALELTTEEINTYCMRFLIDMAIF